MKDTLLIIFVKNIILGKVKTRLAKTIGTQGAFEVYKFIVEGLEKETAKLDCEKHIYFSDVVIQEKWPNDTKLVQSEGYIGLRMRNAFQDAFDKGYGRVALIGSDIPDVNAEIINDAFEKLNDYDTVFGPSEDGGYYLVGLSKMEDSIFKDIEWSTEKVLSQTLSRLDSYVLVQELNDIDTVEDLAKSSIAPNFEKYLKQV